MSFEDKQFMVEFKNGTFVYVRAEDSSEVKQYCADNYKGRDIGSIYLEVYYNDGEE